MTIIMFFNQTIVFLKSVVLQKH